LVCKRGVPRWVPLLYMYAILDLSMNSH
jgi:hypothetical protein